MWLSDKAKFNIVCGCLVGVGVHCWHPAAGEGLKLGLFLTEPKPVAACEHTPEEVEVHAPPLWTAAAIQASGVMPV